MHIEVYFYTSTFYVIAEKKYASAGLKICEIYKVFTKV